MYSYDIISRNKKQNNRLVKEIRKKYGVEFGEAPEILFDSANKVVKDIITDFCDKDLKAIFSDNTQKDIDIPLEDIYDLIRQILLNGFELKNDVDSEILLGLVYYDRGLDYSLNEKSIWAEKSDNRYEEIYTAWESNRNYKGETMDTIRKRYPMQASYKKYKAEPINSECNIRKLDSIFDACLDFHKVMISEGNLVLFDLKDEKITKSNINHYDFRHIEKLYEKIYALIQEENDFHNIALFEKTIGFSYACHIFNYLKDYKSAKKILKYDEIIKKSVKLHAVSLRTTLMEIILSVSTLENIANNEFAMKIWYGFIDEIFSKIEVLFKEVLKVCWTTNYYYYINSEDFIAPEERKDGDNSNDKTDILYSFQISVRDSCEENAKILYRVYKELVTDMKKFDLFHIGTIIKLDETSIFKIRSVKECFKSVDSC